MPFMVPRDMLVKLLSLLRMDPAPSSTSELLRPRPIPATHVYKGFTWIPSLKRKLPHAWCDSADQTSTSIKHDDALVLTTIWDSCITQLFPLFTSRVLTLIRARMLCYSKRRLIQSFVLYLKKVHPRDWTLYVAARSNECNIRGGGGKLPTILASPSKLVPSPSFFHDLEKGQEVLWSYSGSSFF